MTRLLARTYPAGVIVGVILAILVVALVGLPALDLGRVVPNLGYRDSAKYVSMIVHFVTAIVWLGGLGVQLLVLVAPGLDDRQRERLFALVVPWMWISLIALIPTGIYQTINNPVTEPVTSYDELALLRSRPYGQVLVVKHLFAVVTVLLAASAHFVALPRWRVALDDQRPTAGVVTVLRVVSAVASLAALGLLLTVTRLVLFGH
jgi:putative copper export protein